MTKENRAPADEIGDSLTMGTMSHLAASNHAQSAGGTVRTTMLATL